MKKFQTLLWVILSVLFVLGSARFGQASDLREGTNGDSLLYLPLVMRNYPPPPPVFGVEINRGWVSSTVAKAVEGNFYWVRYNGIVWYEIEPTEGGGYNWSASVDSELAMLRSNGLEPVVIIRGTPQWAQMPWGMSNKLSYCGPIKPEKMGKFGDFVRAVVQKYSQPPYSIKYWEFGNEPDVDPVWVPTDSVFGCWGDENDEYYGGGYYAEMLKVVYPIVKSVNPSARVVFGGLLLDCDPTNPPLGKTCRPAKFLEGALRNGGGNSFDILAYHAYPSWTSYTQYYNDYDLKFGSWSHRGGILRGKLAYLREILNNYGHGSKPVHMNEGGLICWTQDPQWPCDDPVFYQSQGNFAIRMYIRLFASNVQGIMWYTLNGPGWRNGGMLSGTTPRSPYYTASFLAQKLSTSEYVRNLSSTDYEGYEFKDRVNGTIYQIYWTNENKIVFITPPANISKVFKFSQTPPYQFVELGSFNGQINFEPVFVVINQ